MRILLVEDNRVLAEWLGRNLEEEKYTVEHAYDGFEADHFLQTETYDLVILDISLPKMDGREVLKRLRTRNNPVPVLILTAYDAVKDRIVGLDYGADDYMIKPFDLQELEARMRALIRRANQQKNPVISCGNLHLNSNTREFLVGDQVLYLTPREHALLEALMMKLGKTVSKKALADSLFSFTEEVNPDAIEIYVHRLRKKLESSDAVIITLRGLGYLLKQRYGV